MGTESGAAHRPYAEVVQEAVAKVDPSISGWEGDVLDLLGSHLPVVMDRCILYSWNMWGSDDLKIVGGLGAKRYRALLRLYRKGLAETSYEVPDWSRRADVPDVVLPQSEEWSWLDLEADLEAVSGLISTVLATYRDLSSPMGKIPRCVRSPLNRVLYAFSLELSTLVRMWDWNVGDSRVHTHDDLLVGTPGLQIESRRD